MKLRNKVLLSMSFIWVLFFILSFCVSYYFLLNSFLNIERQQIEKDLNRVDESLSQVVNSLAIVTKDWSEWIDLGNFVQGKNPHFLEENITANTLKNIDISLLSLWDNQKKLKAVQFLESNNAWKNQLPTGLQDLLESETILFQKKTQGFIEFSNDVYIIASHQISNPTDHLHHFGTLILAKYFSSDLLKKIASITRLELSWLSHLQPNFKALNSNHFYKIINKDTIRGITEIKDIHNQIIGTIVVTQPRTIFMTGMREIKFQFLNLLAIALVSLLLILFILKNFIVKRIEYLNQTVSSINLKKSFSTRIKTEGKDEVTSLTKTINSMLEIIQTTQQKLKNKISERTLALEKNIAEKKTVEHELLIHKEHLVKLAHYDDLTSLPNRIFFNEILNKTLHHANKFHQQIAVLFLDLDRFKKINDALGLKMGDEIIKQMAKRFEEVLQNGEVIARLSGDEFIIFVNNIKNLESIKELATKLLKTCTYPIQIDKHEIFITASIGISIFPKNGTSLEDLQKNADAAMYKAKNAGGNTFHFYSKDLGSKALKHLEMDSSIRKALENEEIILFYQPQFDLIEGKLIGTEALMRWENKELGLVTPNQFIPFAEENGLIVPLGEYVLRKACEMNKAWQEKGYAPITVAVNFSAKQFHQQNIVELIAKILEETNLAPHYLELEVTETAVMSNVVLATKTLQKINEMGVRIALDDFGTGYTSISYLKEFDLDILKIDQKFIKGLPQDTDDAAIVSAVIALAHELKIDVIAEGVETAEQLAFLSDHDCDFVQGYFLSSPINSTDIELHYLKKLK